MDNLFLETGNPILLLCLFLSVYYIRASERERDSSFCLFSSTTKRRTVTQLSSRLTFSFLGGCVAGDNNSPPKTGGGMQPTSSNSFKKKMMKKKKLFSLHLEASVAYWEVRFFFLFLFLFCYPIKSIDGHWSEPPLPLLLIRGYATMRNKG